MSKNNLFPLPDKVLKANFDSLLSLLQRRRSVRDFKKNMIPPELIQKVLLAAECAPMGIPPSDVHVLVLETPEKVRAFSQDFCRSLEEMKWFTSGWFLKLMRPFWNKDTYLLFRDFVKPLVEKYTKSMKEGKNYITYDAPAACYFYGTSYADSADPVIPATYAMLAAESLGLGTCLIGGVHPFIQRGKGAAKFREKYKIRHKSKEGLILLMGYPKIKFRKGIRRTFAKVDYLHPSRAN
ncbi:MAG: nitroreductase family protein [bacterium]